MVPTFPRHPVTMAQQALTTQAAAGGRFALGIGLSHRVTIEEGYRAGLQQAGAAHAGVPLRHEPAAARRSGFVQGRGVSRTEASLMVPDAETPPPVLVAALGPAMLKIAGSMADGTVTSWVGPKTLETHIIPSIRKAAQEAGRPEPRIAVGLPISVTNEDTKALKERYAPAVAGYNELPSYRAMMDIEGVSGPAELAMFGDEATLDAALARLRDIGVTDYLAQVAPTGQGSVERTYEYLASKL
ncbi:MAG: LLM class flavin-dependent oxidoreductase [Dehalococcoidia bacterium]|nr:LLM class flavin-dependent oxidoreductase [Dehalococcoidia bacterium]